MRSPLKSKLSLASKRKQKGAVAVIFGLTTVVLLTMGGLVLDLGHLYVAKAELQNAADAAALAGAKELNETAAGITLAVSQAQAIALKNKYDFATDLVLLAGDIQFGHSPTGPWSSVAAATASPAGKTFVQVDTGAKTLPTYLMGIAGVYSVNTLGVAVAGRFVNDVSPIGVCAVDPLNKTAKYTYTPPAGTGLTELVEFGFRRGVTYNLFGLNPLPSGPSDPYLINPVDIPSTCPPGGASHNSGFTEPFLCKGSSAVLPSGFGKVYANGGMSAGLAAAVNSRFNDYSPPSSCDPITAPPDTNVKQYPCKGTGDPACVTGVSRPTDWMEPSAAILPNREFVEIPTTGAFAHKPNYNLPSSGLPPATGRAQFPNYGVLWSYGPAYQADASTPPKAGAAITPAQANLNPMYNTTAMNYFDPAGYPGTPGAGFPDGTPGAPYNQSLGSPYFQAPTGRPGVRDRRVLNVVLVNCSSAPTVHTPCGDEMTAVGIGKFFLQVPAVFTGGPASRRLDAEFIGLVQPAPISEIKLYR